MYDKKSVRTSVLLPASLARRARMYAVTRGVKGGVTRLIEDALTLHLAKLEMIPVSFDVAFREQYGRDHDRMERVASYGGALPVNNPNPVTIMGRDYFTLTPLFVDHFCTGRWDQETARLVREQRAIWRARGMKTLQMPLHPPGWSTEDDLTSDVQPVILVEKPLENPDDPENDML